jgi:predicted N-formylglutamate amidohydrolase
VVTAWDALGHPVQADHAPAVMLICEHASNRLTDPWTDVAPAILASHAASDLGALGLAQALGPHLARAHGGAELIHAPFSRVIYDLNRSPDRPDACPERSEIHHIPMNAGLSHTERLTRVAELYLPFHDLVRARIARALALGKRPAILTIHSFSPTWHGLPRAVEFGIIHDALPALAQSILAATDGLGLVSALNEPYSAADHVTHTLRLHALPYGLENAMLEIRNDLIATQASQTALAARLAPVLTRAITTVTEAPCPAPC